MTKLFAVLLFTLLFSFSLHAQTYFGDGNGTSGKGGSCCNWAVYNDASSQTCATGVDAVTLAAHPLCQVITKAQFDAFVSASEAQVKTSHILTASGGSPTLGTCNGGSLVAGSTDGQGAISFSGAAIVTSCSVNFGSPPYNGPGCQPSATSATSSGIITTSTGFTYRLTAAFPGGQIAYTCPQ